MIYLTVEEIIDYHTELILLYGGVHGIRDMGLLISAVEMPKAIVFEAELHPTVFDKAAAYLFHIVKNHPFIDGNKRTSTTAALVFLQANGIATDVVDDKELEDLVLKTASSQTSKETIAQFFSRLQ